MCQSLQVFVTTHSSGSKPMTISESSFLAKYRKHTRNLSHLTCKYRKPFRNVRVPVLMDNDSGAKMTSSRDKVVSGEVRKYYDGCADDAPFKMTGPSNCNAILDVQ